MRGLRLLALASALVCGQLVGARAASDRDRLIELDQITISHELCNFPLTDEQAASVRTETDGIIDSANMEPDEADRIYDQYAEAMRRQKASGLCDPQGEWAKTYAGLVAGLAKTSP